MSSSPIIPTGVGLPPGGAAGQVLTKIDGVDYNANWQTPSGGGGSIPLPPVGGALYVGQNNGGVFAWQPETIFTPTTFTGPGTTGYVPNPVTASGRVLSDSGAWITVSSGGGGQVNTVVGGANITVNSTDPVNPVVSYSGPLGQVNTVVGGANITVNSTDPANPVVSYSGPLLPTPPTLNSTLRGDGVNWVLSTSLQNQTTKVTTGVPLIVGNHTLDPGVFTLVVDGSLLAGNSTMTGLVADGIIVNNNLAADTITINSFPPTQPNQAVTKQYVDGLVGNFWAASGANDITNTNSGSVIIQAGLFSGQILATNAAITGAQGTAGGDLVRFSTLAGYQPVNTAMLLTGNQTAAGDKTFSGTTAMQGLFTGQIIASNISFTGAQGTGVNDAVKFSTLAGYVPTSRTVTAGAGLTGGGALSANITLAVDTTVVRTTGAQTVASKTMQNMAFSGVCNPDGLGSSTSRFIMCYVGGSMLRGPLVPAAAQVRAVVVGLAALAGLNAAQVDALLVANDL